MKELQVELNDKGYPIYIGAGLLQEQELLVKYIKSKQVLIVTNTTISRLYLDDVINCLHGFQVEVIELADG